MSQTHLESDRGSTGSTPRWVKMFGIVALVLALLFVLHLVDPDRHGPGRHTQAGVGGHTRP
jgi:hypothetical protein